MFWRRKPRTDEATLELVQQLHGLTMRLKALEERLDAAEAAHERLRGRFYATRVPEQPPAKPSKAEVLRDFGFVPGRPAPHK